MNLVDSCGWLEYFADGPGARFFAPAIEKTEELLVPTIILFEVYKRIVEQRGEEAALQAVAVMQQAAVIDLDAQLALMAARLSAELHLPLADSVILAAARAGSAVLWTQDAHFQGIPGVEYRKRKA